MFLKEVSSAHQSCIYLIKNTIKTVILWNVTLDHKTSHKSHEYICSSSQKYTVWVKIIHFSFMPKIIRTLIKELNFSLVIFIAKNVFWTTLEVIFSIFSFSFAPSDSRFSNSCISAKYCHILTNINGKLIYSALRKFTLMTGFVVQGHTYFIRVL